LLPVMEFADVAGRVACLPEQCRPGLRDILAGERRVIVGHTVQVAVTARQIDTATGSTQGIDDEGITEPDSFTGQAIQIGRFEPGKAGFVALLPLHDAEGIPTLVIGVDEHEIGPVGRLNNRGGE